MNEKGTRRRAFASTVAVTFGTYVGAATLSLLNLVVVARVLAPAGRGDVAFLITVAVITGALGGLSLQEANANIAASDPALRPRLATNSVVLAVVCGGVAAAVVGALVAAVPAVGGEVDRLLLMVALAFVPLIVLRTYLNLLVQADYDFGVTNRAWIAGPATTVTLNTAFAFVGVLTVTSAFGAWLGGQALGTLILLKHIGRNAGFGRPDPRLAARALAFGSRAHLARTLAVGHYRIDQWLVGSLAGSVELGYYSVATAWAEILGYLPGVVVLVQRPDLVRAASEGAANLAARIFRVTFLLTVPLGVLVVGAAPLLCATLLGSDFTGAIDDLRVLTFASFGYVSVELLGSALTARRRPGLSTAAVGVAFVATVVFDILLVPRLGGLGAAIAAVIASTLGGIATAVIFTRALKGRFRDLVPTLGDIPWLWREARVRFLPTAAGRSESPPSSG